MSSKFLSEEEIKSQLADGDELAFEYVYHTYSGTIQSFVLKFVKASQLAEDITQEVFMKLWENRAAAPEIKSLKAWLHTVARNHTFNILKKIAGNNVGMDVILKEYRYQASSIEDKIIEKEYFDRIHTILDALPPRSREVFRLCREENMTYDQVVKELGISRNAVKKHIVSVNKALKKGIDIALSTPVGWLIVIALSIQFSI